MRSLRSSGRLLALALALAAFSAPLLTPTPAAAWWRRGWVRHPGWGWHPGWGYRAGCCWGPGFAIGVAPPIVAVPSPVVIGRAWVPGGWRGPYWVPGHWR